MHAFSSMLPLDPSFHLLVQPGDDLERNDGSSEKPFLMSPELHRILGKSSQVRWYPVLLSTTSATRLVSIYQSVRDRTVLDRHCLAKSSRCQVPHCQQIWDCRKTMASITPDSFGSDPCILLMWCWPLKLFIYLCKAQPQNGCETQADNSSWNATVTPCEKCQKCMKCMKPIVKSG